MARIQKMTFTRLAAGYSVMGALIWLLWPNDLTFVDNPEAWIALVTAILAWHYCEFEFRSKKTDTSTSPNDIRVAREIAKLHAGELRFLLKDTDLWSFIDKDIYSRLGDLCDRWNRGSLFFHDDSLNKVLSGVMERLQILRRKIALDTTPEIIAGKLAVGYKPFGIVPEDEYDRLRKESQVANDLATDAWKALDCMVVEIRRKIPEAWDEPIG